jgi:phosphoserine phosphatase
MIIFDVCNTLYKSNTTFDYIKYVLKKENQIFKLYYFYLLNNKYSPIFTFLFIINKIAKKDFNKSISLKLLKGFTKIKLEKYAEKFYTEYLVTTEINETKKILSDAIIEHNKVILLSSSIEPVVKTIANNLNVSYFSTTLNFNNNVFTGEIKHDLTGKKHNCLPLNIISESTVVTDNFTDYKILQLAAKKIIVVNSKADMGKWKSLLNNQLKNTTFIVTNHS